MSARKAIKGNGGGNDDFGAIDDARSRRVEEDPEDARGKRAQHGDDASAQTLGSDGSQLGELTETISSKIEELPPRDLIGLLLATQTREWQGLLPPPNDYNRYPEDAKKRMLAWNDAQIVDGAKRNDKLANAEIKQGAREQWLSFILNALFISAAFFAFVITGNAASLSFLAVPGVTVAVNIYRRKGK